MTGSLPPGTRLGDIPGYSEDTRGSETNPEKWDTIEENDD